MGMDGNSITMDHFLDTVFAEILRAPGYGILDHIPSIQEIDVCPPASLPGISFVHSTFGN